MSGLACASFGVLLKSNAGSSSHVVKREKKSLRNENSHTRFAEWRHSTLVNFISSVTGRMIWPVFCLLLLFIKLMFIFLP